MKIDKVSIIIENVDEENASVRLVTEPVPATNEEIEDSPAVNLGSQVWDLVQQFLEYDEGLDSQERTIQ